MSIRAGGWQVRDVDTVVDLDERKARLASPRPPTMQEGIDLGSLLSLNGWKSENGGKTWRDPMSRMDFFLADAAAEQLRRLGYSDEDVLRAVPR